MTCGERFLKHMIHCHWLISNRQPVRRFSVEWQCVRRNAADSSFPPLRLLPDDQTYIQCRFVHYSTMLYSRNLILSYSLPMYSTFFMMMWWFRLLQCTSHAQRRRLDLEYDYVAVWWENYHEATYLVQLRRRRCLRHCRRSVQFGFEWDIGYDIVQ